MAMYVRETNDCGFRVFKGVVFIYRVDLCQCRSFIKLSSEVFLL